MKVDEVAFICVREEGASIFSETIGVTADIDKIGVTAPAAYLANETILGFIQCHD